MLLYLDGVLTQTFPGSFVNYTWTNPPAGAHSVRVVATDNAGAQGTNTVNITMQSAPPPPALRLTAPQRVSGQFQFTITGSTNGMTLVIDGVNNLNSTWTPLKTNIATGTNMLFIDTTSTGQPQRHYRVRRP